MLQLGYPQKYIRYQTVTTGWNIVDTFFSEAALNISRSVLRGVMLDFTLLGDIY